MRSALKHLKKSDPVIAAIIERVGPFSIQYREPVTSLISQRIGVTVDLVLYAAILIVVFGVGFGLLAGLRRGVVDNTVITVSTMGLDHVGSTCAGRNRTRSPILTGRWRCGETSQTAGFLGFFRT